MNKPLAEFAVNELHCNRVEGAVRVEPGTVLWDRYNAVPIASLKNVSTKKGGDRK